MVDVSPLRQSGKLQQLELALHRNLRRAAVVCDEYVRLAACIEGEP